MKFNCAKDILLQGISTVMKAVSGRSTMPILDCLLITAYDDGIRLLGNDMELGIETGKITADVNKTGEIALNAKVLADIVRRLPGDTVSVECMENLITIIKGGSAEFRILGSPADEFPKLPEIETAIDTDTFEIFSGQLRDAIRKTIFSVSADESKPAMTGELFEVKNNYLKVAAIDGFRIAVRTEIIDNKELDISAIIPGKSLSELVKILDSGDKSIVSVRFTRNHVLFETDEAKIVSRLIEGKLLDFENIFETTVGTTFVTVNVKDIADTIERAALISREAKKSPVRLIADKDSEKLIVESNTETGTFYEELGAEAGVEIDGLHIKISFNPKYLTDVFRVLDEEKVTMLFTTPLSPCIIKGIKNAREGENQGENHKYLVLPLRDMK